MTMRDGSKVHVVPPFMFDRNAIGGCVYRLGKPSLIKIAFGKILSVSIQQSCPFPDELRGVNKLSGSHYDASSFIDVALWLRQA